MKNKPYLFADPSMFPDAKIRALTKYTFKETEEQILKSKVQNYMLPYVLCINIIEIEKLKTNNNR